MTQPVEFYEFDWSVRHGDSDSTPPVALLARHGAPLLDLTDWTLRAQLRDRGGNLVHTFTRDVGIVLGTGQATVGDQRFLTATVRLALRRSDFDTIPRSLRGGAYDLELSRGEFARTVLGGTFDVVKDVTRDD